jgi:hypothetical protein
LTDGGGAAPGVAGHQVELAPGVGIGDPAAEHFHIHQDGGEGVIQFVNDVAQFETEHIGGGGRGEEKSRHKLSVALRAGAAPGGPAMGSNTGFPVVDCLYNFRNVPAPGRSYPSAVRFSGLPIRPKSPGLTFPFLSAP